MNIDICVCTYRRAHVADTLRSLATLDLKPDWRMRVIVADNDETPSARELIEKAARENSLTLTYIHAPARNISIARNACLDAATAPFVAFIDDDEIAAPKWLSALMAEMESSNADAVLGPVQAVYGAGSPAWMKEGDFHSVKPVWVNNEIITGYAGNSLLRREAKTLRGLRFDLKLGRSGGEDSLFFSAIHRAGGKISYAPDAVATEIVPPERARFLWLLKRRFRFGQTHGMLLLQDMHAKPISHLQNTTIACGKALFCFAMVVPNILKTDNARFWCLRGVMHIGVVCRLFGKRELQQY